MKYFGSVLTCLQTVGIAALLTASAQGASFQFGALVQAGVAGGADWELGAGASTASPTATAELATPWANGVDRLLQVEYLKASNTVNVRVYNGTTAAGAFSQASFSPVGGAAVGANAIWTLPASSFFATALGFGAGGPIFGSSISVSGLTLAGISGALNIIQPILQTSLTATRGFLGATDTVSQTQDIVFQGDSTGSWRLAGLVQMNGLTSIFGTNATGNDLTFGLNASATDVVPEPGTWGLMLLGTVAMAGLSRRRRTSHSS
jgi:hypothetical protein